VGVALALVAATVSVVVITVVCPDTTAVVVRTSVVLSTIAVDVDREDEACLIWAGAMSRHWDAELKTACNESNKVTTLKYMSYPSVDYYRRGKAVLGSW
jgi:hypothetical protein